MENKDASAKKRLYASRLLKTLQNPPPKQPLRDRQINNSFDASALLSRLRHKGDNPTLTASSPKLETNELYNGLLNKIRAKKEHHELFNPQHKPEVNISEETATTAFCRSAVNSLRSKELQWRLAGEAQLEQEWPANLKLAQDVAKLHFQTRAERPYAQQDKYSIDAKVKPVYVTACNHVCAWCMVQMLCMVQILYTSFAVCKAWGPLFNAWPRSRTSANARQLSAINS